MPQQVRALADKMAIAAGGNKGDVYILACLELALRIIRVSSKCSSKDALTRLRDIVDILETSG